MNVIAEINAASTTLHEEIDFKISGNIVDPERNLSDLEVGLESNKGKSNIPKRDELPFPEKETRLDGSTRKVPSSPTHKKLKTKKKKRKADGEKDENHTRASLGDAETPKKRSSKKKNKNRESTERNRDPAAEPVSSSKPSSKIGLNAEKKSKGAHSNWSLRDDAVKKDDSQDNQATSNTPSSPKSKKKKKRLSSGSDAKGPSKRKLSTQDDVETTAKLRSSGKTDLKEESTAKQTEKEGPGVRYVAAAAPTGKRKMAKPNTKVSSLASAGEPTNLPKDVDDTGNRGKNLSRRPSPGAQTLSTAAPRGKRKVKRATNKILPPQAAQEPRKTFRDEERLEKKFKDMGLGIELLEDNNNNESDNDNSEGRSRQTEEHRKRVSRHKRRTEARMEKNKNHKTGSTSNLQEPDEKNGDSDSMLLDRNVSTMQKSIAHIPVATLVEEPSSKMNIWCKIGVGMCVCVFVIGIIVGVVVGVSGREDTSSPTNSPTSKARKDIIYEFFVANADTYIADDISHNLKLRERMLDESLGFSTKVTEQAIMHAITGHNHPPHRVEGTRFRDTVAGTQVFGEGRASLYSEKMTLTPYAFPLPNKRVLQDCWWDDFDVNLNGRDDFQLPCNAITGRVMLVWRATNFEDDGWDEFYISLFRNGQEEYSSGKLKYYSPHLASNSGIKGTDNVEASWLISFNCELYWLAHNNNCNGNLDIRLVTCGCPSNKPIMESECNSGGDDPEFARDSVCRAPPTPLPTPRPTPQPTPAPPPPTPSSAPTTVARARGSSVSLLVQNGRNDDTDITDSFVLISFDLTHRKIPQIPQSFVGTANLTLTKIPGDENHEPTNITIARLPSTELNIEEWDFVDSFSNAGEVEGPKFTVTSFSTTLDIDITDLLFEQDSFPPLFQEDQLLLMLYNSGYDPNGVWFRSRESILGQPKLVVGLEMISNP